MKEFNPLEKIPKEINPNLPKKIIKKAFDPDHLDEENFLDIPINEETQKDLNNQYVELEAFINKDDGQVYRAGQIRENIMQLDRQIENFGADKRFEKLVEKRYEEKKKLREILGSN